ncbi:hypothetical protein [Burkholderia cepacia]|uniref:hypothetical protein n=1 Tax=Burkholderia cepacia TaxID=292 RepID=UPI002FE2A038
MHSFKRIQQARQALRDEHSLGAIGAGAPHAGIGSVMAAQQAYAAANVPTAETLGGLLGEAREMAARLRSLVQELGARLEPVSFRGAQQTCGGIGQSPTPDVPKSLAELRMLIGMLEQTANDTGVLINELRI